jgi:hypothetical protein
METHVAGIRTWNELGRYVKKGQKGIPILAPMIGTKRQPAEEPVEQTDKPKPMLIGFRVVYVFDVAQTEGTELPEPPTVSGEVGTYHERLVDFVQQQGIELEYNERIAPAQGVSYGGKIALLSVIASCGTVQLRTQDRVLEVLALAAKPEFLVLRQSPCFAHLAYAMDEVSECRHRARAVGRHHISPYRFGPIGCGLSPAASSPIIRRWAAHVNPGTTAKNQRRKHVDGTVLVN